MDKSIKILIVFKKENIVLNKSLPTHYILITH
jgi:hypothetical protein